MKKRVKKRLPIWKRKVNSINEEHLELLERIVKKAIPWLVLLLLFIILGEFAGSINSLIGKIFGHETHFLELVVECMEENHSWIMLLDQIIIAFFVIDLYFNFFKSPTFIKFLKKYALDIIAVTPIGLFFRGFGITEQLGLGQGITHVTTEGERIIAEAGKGTKVTRLSRASRLTRFARIITRLPRLVRLWRLKDLKK